MGLKVNLTVRLLLGAILTFVPLPFSASLQKSATPGENSKKPYSDKDAYAIYAVLLEEQKQSFIEIQMETSTARNFTPADLVSGGDSSFYKTWGPVLKDYGEKNRISRVLAPAFPTKLSYKLAYEPTGNSYLWFSTVGFNPERTLAVVAMGHRDGVTSFSWRPYFFKKIDGRWEWIAVEAHITHWMS
jgi:hypothetical protein